MSSIISDIKSNKDAANDLKFIAIKKKPKIYLKLKNYFDTEQNRLAA